MVLLTRDQILQSDDLPYEDVEIPEWGGMVRIRTMTGTERDQFEASITEQRGKRILVNAKNIRAKLVALSVVDGEGHQLFSETDIRILGKKSAKALDRIFDVAQRLSGISDEDVEELAKNSFDGPSEDSTSG